jgi:murein peptide amidase A
VIPEPICDSPHDYSLLVERWQKLAQIAGLKTQVYATAENFDLFCFHSPVLQSNGGIYLSAGIHGDEAGATEGLYQWACLHASRLRELPVMIFPYLNPYGLVYNQRTDSDNRDLNRCYHLDQLPRIQAQKEVIKGHFFRLAVCLHEDYDAQGVYLYETGNGSGGFGRELLAAAENHISIDWRKAIEARCWDLIWMIARRIKNFPALAEAMYLSRHHTERSITSETPSECGMGVRIQANVAILERAIELSLI